jgi:hypothetical protein
MMEGCRMRQVVCRCVVWEDDRGFGPLKAYNESVATPVDLARIRGDKENRRSFKGARNEWK